MITVEMDQDDSRGRSATFDSDGSLVSDSTDFSFSESEDLSSSAASLTFNLSVSTNEEQLRLSRTPPPGANNYLSPSVPQGKMISSVSDPNLYKGPSTPKVPPRPRAQEILTRCTTITRKNASRGGASTTQTEITSR